MCKSAVPQEEGPSLCVESLVLKLVEVASLCILEFVKVLCLLLLLLTEHSGILKEVFMR